MFEHGFCLLWDSHLITWSVITNSLIAVTYFLIPLILYAVAASTNFKIPLSYRNTLYAFSCFIFFCGTGHLIDVLLIWVPWYWFKVVWDGLTGVANVVALCFLLPLAKRFMDFVRIESSERTFK